MFVTRKKYVYDTEYLFNKVDELHARSKRIDDRYSELLRFLDIEEVHEPNRVYLKKMEEKT